MLKLVGCLVEYIILEIMYFYPYIIYFDYSGKPSIGLLNGATNICTRLFILQADESPRILPVELLVEHDKNSDWERQIRILFVSPAPIPQPLQKVCGSSIGSFALDI